MTSLAIRIGQGLGARTGDRLVRNIGWYGVAELAVRLARLVTIIVLARLLLPVDFGIAAAALTAYELVRILGANGTALLIARAGAEDVERASMTAWRVGSAAAILMMTLLVAAGIGLSAYMERADLVPLALILAASLLGQPLADVLYGRLLRAEQARTLAAASAAGILAESIASIALAVAGAGALAVVLPKLLAVPVYLAALRRADRWRPSGTAGLPWREVASFSLPLLGAEAVSILRQHLDKVLVGAALGVEWLGVYSFAYNAGIGLALSFTAALAASLYPHFAAAAADPAEMAARYSAALRRTVAPMTLLLVLQAAAALVYVPLVFGERWAASATLVAVLCLSGLARPYCDAARQYLRARGLTAHEFAGSVLLTVLTLATFAASLPYGLTSAALALASASVVGQLAFALWAGRVARRPHRQDRAP
jgi:PST family polysaccharide transporter